MRRKNYGKISQYGSIFGQPSGGVQSQVDALNSSLAKKADVTALANKVDTATLQNAVENIWSPQSLPSGFNSTDRVSMGGLKKRVVLAH